MEARVALYAAVELVEPLNAIKKPYNELQSDAAHGPDVDGGAVVGGAQEHLWGPVPAGPRRSWLHTHQSEAN